MSSQSVKLVTSCLDILEELNISSINGVDLSAAKQQVALGLGADNAQEADNNEEAVLLDCRDDNSVPIDEICRRSELAFRLIVC